MLIKIYIDPSYFTSDDGPSFLSQDSKQSLVISDSVWDDIHRETSIIRDLYHKDIVMYYQEISLRGIYGYVMEYCPLGNLHNYIVKNGPMTEHQIKKVLYHILSALSYLASKGIVHRDIKPDNILLTNDGSYKLCDFGNSYVLDARATSSSHP